MAYNMDDYVPVADRIIEFRTRHPEGSLTRIAPNGDLVPIEYRNFGGKDWVVYTAFAYRNPEDRFPGVGTAWEPVPGKTQFTRDSEVMVAETSAWGRAMVAALAADTRTGIATAEEIRNRDTPTRQVEKTPERLPAGLYDLEALTTPEKVKEAGSRARQAAHLHMLVAVPSQDGTVRDMPFSDYLMGLLASFEMGQP